MISFQQLDSTLRMELFDGASVVQDREMLDEVARRWWRVRESGGDLVMEVSEDGRQFDRSTRSSRMDEEP